MDNRHMKRFSTPLVIREMQIKTTMRYHLTLARWLSSINQQTTAGEDVEKGEPFLHCQWECKFMQPLWKAIWRHLKKLQIEDFYFTHNFQMSWLLKLETYSWSPHTVIHEVALLLFSFICTFVFSLAFCFSLSLSLTHTHTYTSFGVEAIMLLPINQMCPTARFYR